MEPARSDALAASARVADENGAEWRRNSPLPAVDPARALWPWVFPAGSRPVPIVGPTEALRGRAGGPVAAAPPPPSAVPRLPDPAQPSSWQLAQEVWQESGVTWERAIPERPEVEPGYVEPSGPEAVSAWLADPDPEDAYAAGFQPATATSSSGFATAGEDADLDAYEPVPAGNWRRDPQPDQAEWGAAGSPAFERGSAGAEPEDSTDFEDSAELEDTAYRDLEPEEFGSAADAWSGEDDPPDDRQEARSADTWFTGVGPADARFADARSAPGGPVGGPPATKGVGPFFADSGVVPRQPEFVPRDYARPVGRAQRQAPSWNEYPPDGFPGQAWPAGSGRVPLGAPVVLDAQAPEATDLAEPYDPERYDPEPYDLAESDDAEATAWLGRTPLSEPDELFRAWQGSVNQAAAARGPWSVPRRAAPPTRRRRTLQAAAIGVPVAVIVTVGAGALMMLTGKANEMLAVRADTSTPSAAATGTAASGAKTPASPSAGAVPPAFVSASLAGYPGQRGAVTVASMVAAAGMTLAVGSADGHPAIWLRGANGRWTLESAAGLSAVTGAAGLTWVAHGPAGWIAVGATADGGSTEPVVLASADGVRWQSVTSLTADAGAGTEFLGVAASGSGYVVVGRQMVGGRTFAVLWYSADLRSWTADSNDGLDGRLEASTVNAVAATPGGFVAVGSHGAAQAMWVSPDGRQWRMGSVPMPAGATSATLRSVAATGHRVVAGGYAATRAGDIPVAVVSADGGGQWQQIVLQAPDGLGVVTALTATPGGFTAAGVVGRGSAQRTVTWTSPNGLTWSRPAQTAGSQITALAVAGSAVIAGELGASPTLVALPAS